MKSLNSGAPPHRGAQKNTRRRAVTRQRPQPLPVARATPTRLERIAHGLNHLAHRAALAGAVLAWATFGGLDRLGAMLPGADRTPAPAQAEANTPKAPVWLVDVDGDGVEDFANPTHNAIRGLDVYGSGSFGATRDGGRRKHHGVDYIAAPGDWVESPIAGTVTRYGYAYRRQTELRFVEIRNAETGMTARVLYVDATVADGAVVAAGEIIGTAQNLADRYPGGITNHVHVELNDKNGRLLDPATLLPLGDEQMVAAPHSLAAGKRDETHPTQVALRKLAGPAAFQ